jgi:hypothetical protein
MMLGIGVTSGIGQHDGGLETATIGGVSVLTNSRGFTSYWFAP